MECSEFNCLCTSFRADPYNIGKCRCTHLKTLHVQSKEAQRLRRLEGIEAIPMGSDWKPGELEAPHDKTEEFNEEIPMAIEWCKANKDKLDPNIGAIFCFSKKLKQYYKVRDKAIKVPDILVEPMELSWTPPDELKSYDLSVQFENQVPKGIIFAKSGKIDVKKGFFYMFDDKMKKYYKIRDKTIDIVEPCIDILPKMRDWKPPEECKHLILSDQFNNSVPRAREWAKMGNIDKQYGYFYIFDDGQQKFYEIRDSSNMPGVSADEARKNIESKSDPAYCRTLEILPRVKAIMDADSNDEADGCSTYCWHQCERVFREAQADQCWNSKFQFNKSVHRFAQVFAYEFNSMRNYIGSWCGDGMGMMWWPMPGDYNIHIVEQTIVENDVRLVIAIGNVNEKESPKMPSYWNLVGTEDVIETWKGDGIAYRRCNGINKVPGYWCDFLQYLAWPDHSMPDGGVAMFDSLFRAIEQVEKAGHRTLIHCRAGVGRSGTLRLMYYAWKREISLPELLQKTIDQRALRMSAIQEAVQWNYIRTFIQEVSERKDDIYRIIPIKKKEEPLKHEPPPTHEWVVNEETGLVEKRKIVTWIDSWVEKMCFFAAMDTTPPGQREAEAAKKEEEKKEAEAKLESDALKAPGSRGNSVQTVTQTTTVTSGDG